MDQSIYPYRIVDKNNVCVSNFEREDIAIAIRDKYFPNCSIFKI